MNIVIFGGFVRIAAPSRHQVLAHSQLATLFGVV